MASGFIPPHSGYKDLLSFQKARVVFDATFRFCARFVRHGDRTRDQMIQAARSGKQNILEASAASGLSKEIEIKLVGVARAVIHKPALLLADEPTGNLHSSQAREIMELFRELNQQGTTIVQVTHSEANAAYGSRTIQLRDGWMVGDTANPELQPYEAVKR